MADLPILRSCLTFADKSAAVSAKSVSLVG